MILGFKPQFEELIKRGYKKHTIREDKKERWKPGMIIHFAKGVRTKNYINFMMGECFSVQEIEIVHHVGHVFIYVDDILLGEVFHHGLDDVYEYADNILLLAQNDGFQSVEEFLKWFNKDFSGRIIHWTELRYV